MKSLKPFEFVGATLTVVGSFLPWELAGGFLGLAINGLRVDVAGFKYWLTGIHEFPVYDYGGVLVVLLTLVSVLLVIQPPTFIKNPVLWNLIISVGLMALSLFFVGRWVVHRYEERGSAEPSTVAIGLICVVLGSALLLWRAIMIYRQSTYRKSQNAG